MVRFAGMRGLTAVAGVLALATGGLGTAWAGDEGPPKVSIGKIGNQAVASADAVVKVKPVVKVTGRVKVKSKRLTAREVGAGGASGRAVAVKEPSAKLRAGLYKITTIVKYKTYKMKVKSPAVVTRKLGAKMGQSVIVTCQASSVERFNSWSLGIHATCGSKAFTGRLRVESACALMEDRWSCREDPDAVLGFLAPPKAGQEFDAVVVPWDDLYKTKTVKPAKYRKAWSRVKTKKKVETIRVSAPDVVGTPAPTAFPFGSG